MKKKKSSFKDRMLDIFRSYKIIIYISFAVNIILIIFSYYIVYSNKIYTFSGSDEYIKVNDGIIALNTDINVLNGNNIKYIYNVDYDIKKYKISYAVMDDNQKLIDIISNGLELEDSIKLSEVINNFTTFNLVEKNNNSNHFTSTKKRLINNGLYFVLEAKTVDGIDIFSKVKLNVSKITKF